MCRFPVTQTLALLGVLIAASSAQGQVVSGYVEDAATGERLVGATVRELTSGRGGSTNAYGYFSLVLAAPAPRRGILEVRSLGYAVLRDTFVVGASERGPLLFRLVPDTTGLGTVTVEAVREAAPPGAVRLTARDVEAIPALLGEADPLRALQLSPAVRFGSEGSTGLHVRGGSPDQTLLLLDGAPVYNAAHLAGAVSVFNSDALASVLFVPGAPPARYGGRLAGVVDVTQREGARDRRRGTATVGLLASRVLAEGPLADGRAGYVVSARRSYADAILAPLTWRPGYSTGYYFQDATAKVNVDVDGRTRVFASAYGGRDRFYRHSEETFNSTDQTEQSDTGVAWGNATATVRAAHVLSDRAFVSALAYVSRYQFSAERSASSTYPAGPGGADPRDRSQAFRQSSGLTDLGLRADVEAAADALGGAHALGAGVAIERRWFQPTAVQRMQMTEETMSGGLAVATVGGAAYVSDGVGWGALRADGGLRVDWLAVGGEVFAGIQPRLSGTVDLEGWTARASVGRTWQPLHLLTNPGVGLPTDLWVPATASAPPASSWQAAASVERAAGRWTASAGVFRTWMAGLVEYRGGAGFFASGGEWAADVVTGGGRAYGLELTLARTAGTTECRASYALSRSERTFEAIDEGRPFPYRYDRTHDLSIAVAHRLSARRQVSALFVYATGAAVTAPVAWAGADAFVFSRRNGTRMPDYHRLDVSYEVQYGRGRLALGVTNVYNRLNPYFAEYPTSFEAAGTDQGLRVRYVALFPVLPSVSYRFVW